MEETVLLQYPSFSQLTTLVPSSPIIKKPFVGLVPFILLQKALLGEERVLEAGRTTLFDMQQLKRDEELLAAKHYLKYWLRMDSNLQIHDSNLLKPRFFSYLGLQSLENQEKHDYFGPLDLLSAANILAGPFKIEFTRHPAEHLSFSNSGEMNILKILSLDAIKRLYIPQRTGIARSAFPNMTG